MNTAYKITYLFPLRSNSFPLKYHNTEGSGIPRGGVQFMTTCPPTRATESRGTNRKSSFSTETKRNSDYNFRYFQQTILWKNFLIIMHIAQ